MKQIRFMRILVFFDLPQKSKSDHNKYLKFTKFLQSNGYIRVQYSIYSKLCVNHSIAIKHKRKLTVNAPKKGDIRVLVISEAQYNSIIQINQKFSWQESIINRNNLLIIGGEEYEE